MKIKSFGVLAVATVIFTAFLSASANAKCVAKYCVGVGSEVVKSVYPNSTGNIYLEAPSDKANLNCNLVEGHYMVLQSNHPLFKEVFSTVLTALSTERKLMVRISEGSSNCKVSYVRMWN